jgi:hypothetical protein
MPSPIIYDPQTGLKQSREIRASDTAFGSGSVVSGAVAAGTIFSGHIASGQIGSVHLGDNAVASGDIAANAVASGQIASGSVGSVHLADGAVLSGDIGSGQVGSVHLASGTAVDAAKFLTDDTLVASETISGVRAVHVDTSGRARIAMAAVSGRMPAVGVALSNFASGDVVTIFHRGRIQATALNFSGAIGRDVFVGRSGTLVTATYDVASGYPSLSGDQQQKIGVAKNQSGAFIFPNAEMTQVGV